MSCTHWGWCPSTYCCVAPGPCMGLGFGTFWYPFGLVQVACVAKFCRLAVARLNLIVALPNESPLRMQVHNCQLACSHCWRISASVFPYSCAKLVQNCIQSATSRSLPQFQNINAQRTFWRSLCRNNMHGYLDPMMFCLPLSEATEFLTRRLLSFRQRLLC